MRSADYPNARLAGLWGWEGDFRLLIREVSKTLKGG